MRQLRTLIRKHRLRDSIPVNLSIMQDLFDVRYLPFSPATLGFAFEHVIGVNANLHPFQQRMVLVHEAVHLWLHHPNALFLCRLGDW